MRKNTLFSLCLVLLVQHCLAQPDTILMRYKHYLAANVKSSINSRQLATALDSNGQWSDINYRDTEKSNWQPLTHLKRVKDLALAWSDKRSSFYQQEAIFRASSLALNHWLLKRYKCPNWWHNEIGVPQQMRDIIILLKSKLSPQQLAGALEVLGQYRIHENTTGANLSWSADLGIHYGLLTNNPDLVQKCRDMVILEIRITTADGVQPDYSFHQHDKRLQMYQYGEAFLAQNIRLAWQLRNTALAFPKDKLNLLVDFVLQGWQWMARGIHTVPGTMDRSASRKNALYHADIRSLLPYIADLVPAKKDAFTRIAAHQNGKGALNGFRYFPYSDFTAYQKNAFSFFIKTISTRTLPTESINSENLKGRLLNSGDAYLVQDGNEYFNLMPAWNWDFLPGITSFKGADKIKRQPFNGSVSDGDAGVTGMDYILENKDGSAFISAKKSWFCYGNTVVCLVANLKGKNVDTAYTAMDQSRWRGPVTANKSSNRLAEGKHFFTSLNWVHNNRFVYVPLGHKLATVQLRRDSAKWTTINTSEADEPVEEKIFMPLIVHNNLTREQSFGYMASYCTSPVEAARIAANPGFKIISNDSSCQAVSYPDNTFMLAFFQPSSVVIRNSRLTVSKPCLLLIKNNKLYASDPLQQNKSVTIELNNKTFEVTFPEHGFSTGGLPLL